jgi:hypothetical protein
LGNQFANSINEGEGRGGVRKKSSELRNKLVLRSKEMQVGTGFVHACLYAWIEKKLEKKGRTLDEQAKLPTPQILGVDEFAMRIGIV